MALGGALFGRFCVCAALFGVATVFKFNGFAFLVTFVADGVLACVLAGTVDALLDEAVVGFDVAKEVVFGLTAALEVDDCFGASFETAVVFLESLFDATAFDTDRVVMPSLAALD